MEIEFIIILVVFFLASFVQSLTGFGFAIISIPLLSIFLPVKYIIPLGALCGLVVNLFLFFQLRRHIKFFELKDIFFGAIIGVPLGVFFLAKASPELIKISLAVILLLFVHYKLRIKNPRTNLHPKLSIVSGFVSGMLGGAFNTSGPPVIVYFSMQTYDKIFKKAQITGYFVVLSIVIVVIHYITGITTETVLWDFLKTLPAALLGILAGSFLFSKIKTEIYDKIILFTLFLISLFLIFSSI